MHEYVQKYAPAILFSSSHCFFSSSFCLKLIICKHHHYPCHINHHHYHYHHHQHHHTTLSTLLLLFDIFPSTRFSLLWQVTVSAWVETWFFLIASWFLCHHIMKEKNIMSSYHEKIFLIDPCISLGREKSKSHSIMNIILWFWLWLWLWLRLYHS